MQKIEKNVLKSLSVRAPSFVLEIRPNAQRSSFQNVSLLGVYTLQARVSILYNLGIYTSQAGCLYRIPSTLESNFLKHILPLETRVKGAYTYAARFIPIVLGEHTTTNEQSTFNTKNENPKII